MAKKAYIGVKSTLPNGYTRLEYIESTGTQRINTGLLVNKGDDIRMELDTQLQTTGERTYAGCDYYMQYKVMSTYGINEDYTGAVGAVGNRDELVIHYRNNIETLYVNDKEVESADWSSRTEANVRLGIFCMGTANDAGWYTERTQAGKLYGGKIYVSGTIVREYIPCRNSSGEVGLYDNVNGVFYGNAGTDSFVAGGTVRTPDSVARKIKKGYVGVGGLAKKIKKAYIGIGGVARPCWSGGELAYYGTVTSLSAQRKALAATTIGDYALFGGGGTSSNSKVVDAYNTSLTRSIPTSLSTARQELAATNVGNYALFGGGSYVSTVDAYDKSLTHSKPSNLNIAISSLTATTVGDYALFGGGYDDGYSAQDRVVAYDTSLTRTTATKLSSPVYALAATTIGDYALFGGGWDDSTRSKNVDAYNKSLTKTNAAELQTARSALAAGANGKYALFAGGYDTTYSTKVDAYDTSLTRSTVAELSAKRSDLNSTSIGEFIIFAGGYPGGRPASDVVDVYDGSLTRTVFTALSLGRHSMGATTVGNYALFGGGHYYSSGGSGLYASAVDAYTVA